MSGQVMELIHKLEEEIAEQKTIIEELNKEAQKYREYILLLENKIGDLKNEQRQ